MMNTLEIIPTEETEPDLHLRVPWNTIVDALAESVAFKERFDRIFGLDEKTANQKEIAL